MVEINFWGIICSIANSYVINPFNEIHVENDWDTY